MTHQPPCPPHAARVGGALLLLGALAALLITARPTAGAEALTAAQRARIDAAVNTVLERTGVPSASVALVRDRTIVHAQAYGWAQLEPKRPATAGMRYAIGSISKEFAATAVLMLQERGALSIDDPAGKYLQGLGPAAGVTIRSLLSHTSGVRDYWPQDYDPPEMLEPIDPRAIVARWADQPLDFPAGSAWQYSNTGYTVAGLIAEQVAHEPLFGFLKTHVFTPLGMTSVYDFDAAPLPPSDATGYTRYALGPPRPAAKEGRGWLFAAGELAMTASDLARWDIALIERRLLKPASYRDLTTEVLLTNGVGSRYALGLDVGLKSGRRVLEHGGEVGGFTSQNVIYPDDGAAIVVLTNQDAADASEEIADALSKLMFVEDSPADAAAVAASRRMFAGLQQGRIDPALLTANARSYFTPRALADFRASLGSLGPPSAFELLNTSRRGGLITRAYDLTCGQRQLRVIERSEPGGLVEQYMVGAR
ncbi:MAG TPA: serine hydrolase domain-containing protein [Steroidobacteraceae bacterium]|nr:serine hydrolase domain-containing protein [Steroidobacteraceae bacterium]